MSIDNKKCYMLGWIIGYPVVFCKSNAKYTTKLVVSVYCKLKFASIWYVCFARETYSHTIYLSVGSYSVTRQPNILIGTHQLSLTDIFTKSKHMTIFVFPHGLI
jgi:hypothetical protein